MKNNTKQFQIRPYARLLTMLGEQLIKNERIALIELIKNSYDADADWVKIIFKNFNAEFKYSNDSKIIIEDNGQGMTADVIEKHWLNPATPEKLKTKKTNSHTKKGRVIQGEKGIGRFAMLKLGQKIKIITRPINEKKEYVIDYDFSAYDNDFLTENGKEKELYLDDLRVSITEREPEYFIEKTILLGTNKINREPMGTHIEISNIKGDWSDRKVGEAFYDTTKLYSGFIDFRDKQNSKENDFEVLFYRNNKSLSYRKEFLEKLNFLLNNCSVLRLQNGYFNLDELAFSFDLNDVHQKISITDPMITGLKVFNKEFGNAANDLKNRTLECGSFRFTFYIFDFSAKVSPKYKLDRDDKKTIKEHRIYLYRDNIRVYPYGEPDDDWLQIDMYRGTISAGDFLSNDQVVGRIDITQDENKKLKDKTNREGLIEDGNALSDFISLLKTFLAYIRNHPYAQYRKGLDDRKIQDVFKNDQVKTEFDELKSMVPDNAKLKAAIDKVEKDYTAEKEYLVKRFETAEDLAGVGLSVETASHDIVSIMEKVFSNLDGLINNLLFETDIDKEQLLKELQSIRGGLGFIEAQLKDIQLLFRSSKQRRRSIRVIEVLQKVEKMYQRQLNKKNNDKISLEIRPSGSPLVAKTTDAVLLQLFLNLVDNSIYWLNQIDIPEKKIVVFLDGDKQQMIFSDNGPGIKKEDAPYIFDSFYSGKGEDGRGLGLYIARQLLERNDYSIKLAEIPSEKKLSGTNFVIDFVSRSENEYEGIV
jgi:signal transduction histidine kinase